MPYFKHQFSVEFVDVQLQEGSHDCGLFALAYITSICDPAVLLYKQNAMRKHILKSIEDGVMTAFPTSASRLPKASIRKNIAVYCICLHINDGSKMIQCDICRHINDDTKMIQCDICRHINDGTKMIQCDICQQWFHVACMKIDKSVHRDRRAMCMELPFVQYSIN